MNIDLEKIDIIRERAGVSYKKAKEVLESVGGDVVDAIIAIEEETGSKWTKNMSAAGNEILDKLKKVIEKGNITRIMLKKDDEVLLNIPVTAGAIGVILAPVAAIFGVSAALVTKTKVEIMQDDGKVVDLSEIAEEKVDQFKNKFTRESMNGNIDENIEDLEENDDF